MNEDTIVQTLENKMKNKPIRCSVTSDKRVLIEVDASCLRESVGTLLEATNPRFVTLSATDKGMDIELMYHFSIGRILVTIHTEIAKETSQIESITGIVPPAEFIEKEVSELFGVTFEGHPRENNLVLPSDWPAEDKPMRARLVGSLIPQARIGVTNFISYASSLGIPQTVANREKAGLSKMPPMASNSEDDMEKFRELIKKTGFDKRAGYDWKKGKLRYR